MASARKKPAEAKQTKQKIDPLSVAPTPTTFAGAVFKHLSELNYALQKANPDSRDNIGRILGELAAWQVLASTADKRVEYFKDNLKDSGIIEDPTQLDEGEYILTNSPSFNLTLKVTAPVRRFNEQKMIELLNGSKYKVPELVARELIGQAKIPTTPQRIMKVVEK